MRLCIAGTRGYYGPAFYIATRFAIGQAIKKFSINATIDEIVSGMCPDSPDMIGVDLAKEAKVPVKEMPADWTNIEVPNAVVRYRKDGTAYNLLAGRNRNKAVAEYLAQYEHLVILIWDGKSGGTNNFKGHCERLGLRVFEYIPQFQEVQDA